MGDNRPAIYLTLLAIQAVGAVPVPVHPNASDEDVDAVRHLAMPRHAVAGSDPHLRVLAQSAARRSGLMKILCLSADSTVVAPERVIPWPKLKRTMQADGVVESSLASRLQSLRPDHPSVVVMTSGEIAPPRAIVLSHRILGASARFLASEIPLDEKDELLAFLPISWIGDLLQLAAGVIAGAVVSTPESPDTVPLDMRQIAPTVLFATPLVLEKFVSEMENRLDQASSWKRRYFESALARNRRADGGRAAGRGLSGLVDDALMLSPLRSIAGIARLRTAVSMGSATPAEIVETYAALGVQVRSSYGIAECGGCACFAGEGGRVVPGIRIRLGADSEVLIGDDKRTSGELTAGAETIPVDDGSGWMATGDRGRIGARGELSIGGRLAHRQTLASGEPWHPFEAELGLLGSRFIRAAIVLAGDREEPVALIMPDFSRLQGWARRRDLSFSGYESLVVLKPVLDLIAEHVASVNARLARNEPCEIRIAAFAVLPTPLTVASGHLTPTGKIRRNRVIESFADLIERLNRRDPAVSVEPTTPR